MNFVHATVGAVVAMAAVSCGGSQLSMEETATIYQRDMARARLTASTIVFVPGILGSELRDSRDGDVVWGTFWESESWEAQLVDLALPWAIDTPVAELRDTVVPGGELLEVHLDTPFGDVSARAYPGVFEGLVQSLVAGDSHHVPEALSLDGDEHAADPIIGFGYDWRRDLASEAERLHRVVVTASEERLKRTGDPRIDLVAHSMGTQLVRWYLRYGTQPVPEDGSLPELTWAGVKYVKRAILVAPPNLGEAQVLARVLEGAQQHPLLPVYPPALTVTFASTFQLFPRIEDARVVWADDGSPVDIYDADLWVKLKWGPFAEEHDEALQGLMPEAPTRAERLSRLRRHVEAMLAHAKRFHRAMDLPARPPPELHLHMFVGDAMDTKTVLRVDRRTGALEWAPSEPGDGTVTRTSALAQSRVDRRHPPSVIPRSVHFLDSDHLGMVGAPAFIDDALFLLLEDVDPPDPEKGDTHTPVVPPPPAPGRAPSPAASASSPAASVPGTPTPPPAASTTTPVEVVAP